LNVLHCGIQFVVWRSDISIFYLANTGNRKLALWFGDTDSIFNIDADIFEWFWTVKVLCELLNIQILFFYRISDVDKALNCYICDWSIHIHKWRDLKCVATSSINSRVDKKQQVSQICIYLVNWIVRTMQLCSFSAIRLLSVEFY